MRWVSVTLDTMVPDVLLTKEMPESVYVRLDSEVGPGGYPVVEVAGEPEAVRGYIEHWWGRVALEGDVGDLLSVVRVFEEVGT